MYKCNKCGIKSDKPAVQHGSLITGECNGKLIKEN